MRAMDFWENVKPSKLGTNNPDWVLFNDAWVDEVRRAVKACTVFAWFPIYCNSLLNPNIVSVLIK